MTIYESLVFISANNINRLEKIYGRLKVDELKQIVNKHLSDALDEVENERTKVRSWLINKN